MYVHVHMYSNFKSTYIVTVGDLSKSVQLPIV